MIRFLLIALIAVIGSTAFAQSEISSEKKEYKKRVLESIEIDILSSYYTQDGVNAAVSGGIGTEDLQDATATFIVSIPLNDDDVLTIDAGVSAYTSASSSNINPFDSDRADAFIASSGESQSDVWSNMNLTYAHSSEDRNKTWSFTGSFAKEYDYTSIGFGGSYAKLFNQKNTEFSVNGKVYIDSWDRIYPIELRPPGSGDDDDDDDEHFDIANHTITGNPNYSPSFVPLSNAGRQSYTLGLGLSQILSKNLQGSIALDITSQQGQLSTPFQRVYFQDIADSFVEDFHLADDIERLPDSRIKTAIGGRLNYYVNEVVSVRSYYRYYSDNWGIDSHTASIEIPIKLMLGKITLLPSYRFYNQSAADYFASYDQHLSTDEFYTSDFDLSKYNSNQFGFGIAYTDIFTSKKIWKLAFKSIELKYYKYDRNTSFTSSIATLGLKFVVDK